MLGAARAVSAASPGKALRARPRVPSCGPPGLRDSPVAPKPLDQICQRRGSSSAWRLRANFSGWRQEKPPSVPGCLQLAFCRCSQDSHWGQPVEHLSPPFIMNILLNVYHLHLSKRDTEELKVVKSAIGRLGDAPCCEVNICWVHP
ncbi:hypothetical protein NN561_008360 [Cricetulus griseus]